VSDLFPAIPEPAATVESLYEVVKTMKQVLDTATRQRGFYGFSAVFMSPVAPAAARQYDLWVDTSNLNKMRVYDGRNWLAVTV
jgi:hypothetical protein